MASKVDVTHLPRTEDLVAWLASLVPVIVLLLWDVWKAWKRRAPWIPGQALVLSALIIQLLSFIDYSHIRVYSGSRYQTEEVEAILVKNHLVIDSGRLMMCVLIAYLLPGMARSGSIMDGSNLAALALSIASHVFSELRSFWTEGSDRIIFDVCSTILILTIIYLLVLLIKAVMSGRTICRIGSQKIPSVLSRCCPPCERPTYNDIKDRVSKCWIVVRFSQPDYVLVRTGLCSMAFPVVTVCIGVHVINRTYVQFTDNESLNSGTKRTLVQFVIVGQCVIVLIGWIVLLVRWVTSLMQGDTSRRDYLYSMSIEDAETDLTAFFIRFFVRDKRIQEKAIRYLDEKFRYISSLLCNPWHWVKKLFEKFSMQNPENWLTSTKLMLSHIKTTVIEKVVPVDGQISKYEDTLKMIIPGESASFLLRANQWGFRRVERYMDQGEKDGKRSPRELIRLLSLPTVTTEGEVGISAKKAKADLQKANKNSWKRTAVSLIHCMISLYDGSDASVIEKAMQCYIEGWEYMNFVDGLNEEVKSLGRQADKEFDRLRHSSKQPLKNKQPLKEQLESRPEETWTLINTYFSAPEINKIHQLQCVLANVYNVYMTEDLNKAVLQECRKLAEEGKEEEILDVAFLAAKAQGLLDEVRERNNTDQPSTSATIPPVNEETWHTALKRWLRWLLHLNEEVRERNNTDQASTSSTIPPVNEQVREGNNTDQASTSSTIPPVNEQVGEGNDLENQIQKASPNSEGQTRHTGLMRLLRPFSFGDDNNKRRSTKSNDSSDHNSYSNNSSNIKPFAGQHPRRRTNATFR